MNCIIDGVSVQLNNYKIPFGLIFARGNSIFNGRIRKWLGPGDVTLNSTQKNIDTPDHHEKWKNIIKDKYKWWIASWKNEVVGKTEYIYLSKNSQLRMSQNQKKFMLA